VTLSKRVSPRAYDSPKRTNEKRDTMTVDHLSPADTSCAEHDSPASCPPRRSSCSSTSSDSEPDEGVRVARTSKPAEEGKELAALVKAFLPRLLRFVAENDHNDIPTHRFSEPEDLKKLLGKTSRLPEEGHDISEMEQFLQLTLDHSVRTGSPLFMDKLYAGADPIGMMAEWIVAILNTNCYIYGVAPVFTLLEHEVIAQCSAMFGYDPKLSDGLFVPGGSYANLVSVILAKNKYFPHAIEEGWRAEDRPVVVNSKQGHYSTDRAAIMMGIGLNNVVYVPADLKGQMDIEALDAELTRLINSGRRPFYVNALAGTTVLGGFDRFKDIAAVCKKHKVWLHIDASWGGGVVVSEKHRHLLEGANQADSITWNPHKMLSVPLQCSMLLVKQKGQLSRMFTKQAEYLFHGESVDIGTKSPQCGRKPDVFKLWLSWKRHGRKGFEKRVDHAFSLVEYFTKSIKEHPNFDLVAEPTSLNVCFRYSPAGAKRCPAGANECLASSKFDEQLKDVTALIHQRLRKDGQILIDYAPLAGYPKLKKFFRVIVSSPKLSTADIDFIISEIDRHGKNIWEQM